MSQAPSSTSAKVVVYDTTLRDGTQAEELNLTLEDKLRVALRLDALGLDFLECGWPGSNPTDKRFFKEIKGYDLKHSRISAFGSTHAPRGKADSDPNLRALVEAAPQAMTIFGKSWDLHAREALGITLERNLELIADSLAFLRPHTPHLFFDAEHFFDGYKANPEYALACLRAAAGAGVDCLVLCDTNGGSLPGEVREIMARVRAALPDSALGIHAHNDGELAVANSLEAVAQGARHVQGTMNGYGERCGNANLSSIIPNLELKMGLSCLPEGNLAGMTEASHFVSEVANLRPLLRQPFVGRSAFAHKGGIHVSAVMKNPRTYEHIRPEQVGNVQRVLLSDLAGRSNILVKAKAYGYDLDKTDPLIQELLTEIKEREAQGYEYSAAEASFELLFFRTMGWTKRYFQLLSFRVLDTHDDDGHPFSEATVMLRVSGEIKHTAATGHGPVNALDNALRKALLDDFPALTAMRLLDFKVRVMSGAVKADGGTASMVRVLIESGDGKSRWTTVGVSHNIIDASWQALTDAVIYKLFRDDPNKWPKG